MRLLHRVRSCFVGGLLLAAAPMAGAADVTADYSQVANPNPPWTFGETSPLGGPFLTHPNNFFLGATVHAWDQGFANSSFVSKNIGAASVTLGTTVWSPGAVVLRPGINAQYAVVRYTVPVAGMYSYSVTFASADNAGGTRDVHVLINGVPVSSSPLNGPVGSPPVTFSSPGVPLAVGDTIDYAVGVGGSPGDFNRDAAMLRNAVVNLVTPTPVLPCRVRQPWTKPLASHASVVATCQGDPVSFAPIAMDDFQCDVTTTWRHFTWWGTNPTQNGVPQRAFLIRIWIDQGCNPVDWVYQECVIAKPKVVGIDCQGLRVFRFVAKPSVPFTALAGQRYWLQISEIDRDPDIIPGAVSSPNPDRVDFQWSAHRDIKDCRALQMDIAGGVKPLFDPCDAELDDLAFRLRSRFVTGVITPVPVSPVPLRIEVRRVSDNALEGFDLIEPDPETGQFDSFFDIFVDAGECRYRVLGGASPGVELLNPIDPSMPVQDLGLIMMPQGDADNSGQVRFGDITTVLGNWLSTGPFLPPAP